MKVIESITDSIELGMFEVGVRFKPYKGNENIDHEQYLNEICEWVSNTFTKNFVIIEQVETHVAGGGGERNKLMWERRGFKVNRDNHSALATYELRCYISDITAFMLKWS